MPGGSLFKICGVGLLACAWSFAQTNDGLIVPGTRIGPLTASSSRVDLDRIFGAAQVADRAIDMGDGSSRSGTVVHGDDSSQALAILWTDETRTHPEQVVVCYGIASGANCRWRTASAIGMNTTLRDLEKANGGPFILLGFERDFAGTVLSWQGGRLEREFEGTGRLVLRLSAKTDRLTPAEEAAVLAERVSSDHLAMRKLNPRVYQILMVFPRPSEADN